MTPLQKTLAVVVAAEVLALGGVKAGFFGQAKVPAVSIAAIDATTAREIEAIGDALRPDRVQDWIRLGRVYRAFNVLGAAEYCFAQADRVAPQSTGHLYDWVATLSRMGETKRAAAIGQRGIAAGIAETEEIRLILARDLLRDENVAAAEPRLRELADTPDATLLLARLLTRTGRATEAGAILDRWLETSPDDFRGRQMRSWVAETLGNAEEARRHHLLSLRSRAWIHRGDASGHRDYQLRDEFARGKIAARVQQLEAGAKWDAAIEALREAQAISWSDEDAARLASLELSAGRPTRAIEELERLIQLTGNSGELLLALARAWLAAGDASKAQAIALEAERMGANQSETGNLQIQQFLLNLATERNDAVAMRMHQARAQFELAKQAWFANDVAQAQQQLARATALAPDQPHAWFYLGETQAILGNTSAARQSYQRCLRLQPNHGRALAALERLR